MQLEEAAKILDRQERSQVTQERGAAEKALFEAHEMMKRYKKKCVEVAARSGSSSSSAGKPGAKRKKKQEIVQISEWPDRNIELVSARSCCPPKGFIWASQKYQNWQAHYEGFSRISRAWNKHTYKGALLECLRYLWTKHASVTNIPLSDVPVRGLFVVEGAAQEGASSSSDARVT